MSGFSADWLRLREPADRRARDRGLLAWLAGHFAGFERIRILDLGCGTGANLRAVAPALPVAQYWHLIDHDRLLLAAARQDIADWREGQGSGLRVTFGAADLARGVDTLLAVPCDLVTTSALLDLVSERWLDALMLALAAHKLPLYAALNYDGAMLWDPPPPASEAMRSAFNAHQKGDKGFGPAAGPDAIAYLTAQLRRASYDVTTAASPWRLDATDHALIAATAGGIAGAARETGFVGEQTVADWLAAARSAPFCEIGHVDILALPYGGVAR